MKFKIYLATTKVKTMPAQQRRRVLVAMKSAGSNENAEEKCGICRSTADVEGVIFDLSGR